MWFECGFNVMECGSIVGGGELPHTFEVWDNCVAFLHPKYPA